MPVRKKVKKQAPKESDDVQKEEISSTSAVDSSCVSIADTTSNASMQQTGRITKSFVEENLQETLREIDEFERRTLENLDTLEAQMLMITPPEKLKMPVSLDKLSDLMAIFNDSIWEIIQPTPLPGMTPTSVNRGRPVEKITTIERTVRRSISHNRLSIIEESASPRRRSCSAEPMPTPRNRLMTPQPTSALQTPMNRHVPSRIMMTNKYTVRKPMGQLQPSIPMKRVMRAGEEAISTSGSPLFVQGRVPNEPEIIIPLNNGVILNIDPNNPEQRMAVPHFDEETVRKIRNLCRKLENCIGE